MIILLRLFAAIAVLTVVLRADTYSQTRVVTISGKEYEGEIVTDDSAAITLRTGETETKIFKSNISTISYDGSNVARLSPSLDLDYPFVGVTLIGAGGINLTTGYYGHPLGIRLGAGYIPEKIIGAQVSLLRNIYQGQYLSQHLSLFTLVSSIKRPDRDRGTVAVGFAYDIHAAGFFGEIGFGIGSGSFETPQLQLQFGYLYEFR